jgi:Tfp pilus assembly PilM family ATPase
MQRLQKCLGVDIGVSAVKIVEISVEKKGVRIGRCLRGEIQQQASGETDRVAAITKVIKDLTAKQKNLPKQAVFSIPGQNVFIRRFQVPRTTEERLKKIIAYEARQQIPFNVENAIVEYQIQDDENKPEVDVLLAAVKREVVTEFMKIVVKSGLTPVAISVSSLALFTFNALESCGRDYVEERLSGGRKKGKKRVAGGGFDFAALFGKKKGIAGAKSLAAALEEDDELPEKDVYEEVKAFINIGAQTFDLAIARLSQPPQLGFVRSVATAGNDLTRILQDKMRLESTALAEELKRDQAIIIIPGRENEAEARGISKEASEFATTWADRLISDIRRSFDYYISQPEGMAVDSIVLSGGCSQLPNLAAYIEEKLGIPVEIKTRVDCEAVELTAQPEDGLVNFTVAIGLGYTGLGLSSLQIDFLPTDLKKLRDLKRKNIETGIMAGCIGIMIFLSTIAGNDQMEAMERWLNSNQSKIDQVNRVRAESEKAQAERAALNAQVNKLGNAVGDRLFWLEFLGVIETAKPPDILITRIAMEPDGRVLLFGEAEVLSSCTNFLKRLQSPELKSWISKVTYRQSPKSTISRFIGKEVQSFELEISVVGKESRLAFVRQTFAPGLLTPTPTPANMQPAVRPGGAGAGSTARSFAGEEF